MSADPANGQSNLDVILKAMAPERRETFLRARNRLKQFNENDELLAVAHYLDTVVVMVDGLISYELYAEGHIPFLERAKLVVGK